MTIKGAKSRPIAAALIAIAFSLALTAAVPAPASAASCPNNVSNLSSTNYATAHNDNRSCRNVQARLTKYYASTINYYYGPPHFEESYVYNANGTDAGKHFRYQLVLNGPWSTYRAL